MHCASDSPSHRISCPSLPTSREGGVQLAPTWGRSSRPLGLRAVRRRPRGRRATTKSWALSSKLPTTSKWAPRSSRLPGCAPCSAAPANRCLPLAAARVRRAYKRKALELHPDRNINDVENATRKFAEVQTAYEVLSDPQERAWYDSHRDAILRGDPDAADAAPAEFHNIRLTTTEDIYALIGRFNSSVPFNDSPGGFFGILDGTFAHLAEEEEATCEWDGHSPVRFPPFGSAGDSFEAIARPFYAAWSDFSTKKSFSWKDKYRLTDAPDRRIRRLMEKENKKLRDEAIREFNDAVRSLVAFVKKRDPRYVPNTQSEAERQQVLRDSAATQAARSRALNQEKLAGSAVPEWAQARDENNRADEFSWSEDEISEVEHIECVVCNKTFKSEKQFEAHERSRKHLKAVQNLRREMKRENMDLRLDLSGDVPANRSSRAHGKPEVKIEAAADALGSAVASVAGDASPVENYEEDTSASSTVDAVDDDYAPRDAVQDRLFSAEAPTKNGIREENGTLAVDVGELNIQERADGKKVGKAKAKRERKAGRLAGAAQAQQEVEKHPRAWPSC